MVGGIFDIDGTILDSMTAWVDITNEFFVEHGISVSKTDVLSYQDMSFEESLVGIHRDFLPDMSVEDMFDEFRRRAEAAYSERIPAKDGVCDYITALHRNGVKLAVASSGFDTLIIPALKRLGIYDCFSAFAYSSEVGCSKSNPDIYLLAAKRLGVPPENCTVYEDILTGIRSAKSVGFKTVAVADATNAADTKRLIQSSDRYITGWHELLSNI